MEYTYKLMFEVSLYTNMYGKVQAPDLGQLRTLPHGLR